MLSRELTNGEVSPEQEARRYGPAALLVSAACLCCAVLGVGLTLAAGAGMSWGLLSPACSAVLFTVIGGYLVAHIGARAIGGLLLLAGAAWSASIVLGGYGEIGLSLGWPGGTGVLWLSTWLWPVGLIAPLCLVPLLFPDGRFVSPRWRAFGVLALLAVASCMLSSAVAPGPMLTGTGPGPENPAALEGSIAATLQIAGLASMAVTLLAGLAALIVRWKRGNVEQRQQVKYLIAATLFVAVAQASAGRLPDPLQQFLFFLMPVAIVSAIGLAVARYRLYDIDVFIRTGVLYILLIGFLLIAYTAVAAALTSVATLVADPAVPVIAALVVALLLEPSRRWLHVRLDRWFFGGRRDPMRVLASLRSRLDDEKSSPGALVAVTESVAAAVRSPFVAVTFLTDSGERVVASTGTPIEGTKQFPLKHQGELVGKLLVAPRHLGAQFNDADDALLVELAARAGATAATVRLSDELATARRRAYRASVEERARLGRDLHDGLGPLLAGTNLAVESVRRSLQPDEAAFTALTSVAQRIRTASTEVRRIARSLSPGPLAELGLTGALEDFVQSLISSDGPDVRMDNTVALAVPPAVEQVAYLVILEATNNALRHGRADQIRISLHCEEPSLTVTVADDGVGLGGSYVAGLGLASMRQRCDAVGGQLSIVPGPTCGTVVTAVLPIYERP